MKKKFFYFTPLIRGLSPFFSRRKGGQTSVWGQTPLFFAFGYRPLHGDRARLSQSKWGQTPAWGQSSRFSPFFATQRVLLLIIALLGFFLLFLSVPLLSQTMAQKKNVPSKAKQKDPVQVANPKDKPSKGQDNKTSKDDKKATGGQKDLKDKEDKKAKDEAKKAKDAKDAKEAKEKALAEEKKKREKYFADMVLTFRFGTTQERIDALRVVERLTLREEIDKVTPGIKECFADMNNKLLVRKAVEVVGKLNIKSLLPEVTKAVGDDNEEVRRTAIETISRMKAKEGGDAIFAFFKKQNLSINDNSTHAAMAALTELKHEKFAQYAINSLRREYPTIQADATTADNKQNQGKDAEKTAKDSQVSSKPVGEKKNKTSQKDAPPKNKDATDKKESSDDPSDLYWQKDETQKMDSTITGEIILHLGNMNYAKASEFFRALIKAAFLHDELNEDAEDGKKIDEKAKEKSIALPLSVQGYLVNALGKMEDQAAIPLLQAKIKRIEGYTNNDRQRKYQLVYLQALAALARLGDNEITQTLLRTLRDDNPGVRFRSAKLLAEIRSAEVVDILYFRAKHDKNHRVSLEALKALMEIADPGSTTNGNIIGKKPTAEAQKKAMEALQKYLDYTENPYITYTWILYVADRITKPEIEAAVIGYLEKMIERFLPQEKQEMVADTAGAIIKNFIKKEKRVPERAMQFLEKYKEKANHRYGARRASLHLREIDRLKKEGNLSTSTNTSKDSSNKDNSKDNSKKSPKEQDKSLDKKQKKDASKNSSLKTRGQSLK